MRGNFQVRAFHVLAARVSVICGVKAVSKVWCASLELTSNPTLDLSWSSADTTRGSIPVGEFFTGGVPPQF